MQGYYWAETFENGQLIVLIEGGKGYVPGREGAINLDEIFIREPVQWPARATQPSLSSEMPNCGALAPVAVHGLPTIPWKGSALRAS